MSDLSSRGRLQGKRTLVTGAGRGIGRSVAERCVAEGARVVLVDLDAGESERVAAELGAEAGLAADVTDSAAVDAAVAETGLGFSTEDDYLAGWLREAGGGVIANTGSIAGMWGTNGQAAYAAAKAGVIMLTKCMALDGAPEGIRVNAVSPGFIVTPMFEDFIASQPEGTETLLAARTPIGRLGKPLDIADACVYLLSDEAAWVTGTNLVVDGGVTSGIWG